jgi:hypothetical protein
MSPTETDSDRDSGDRTATRRSLLQVVGVATALSFVGGTVGYARKRPDADADGVADTDERGALEERVADVFGDQFEGFDTGRRDLLIDVRYVGDTDVDAKTKRTIERLYRREGIYAQWLDHPTTYDQERFERRYGWNAREVLWGGDSFYRREVEQSLRDVAVQVVVVPGRPGPEHEGMIYSPWTATVGGENGGHVNGFSVGNRAVVAEREDPREQQRLLLHEIAHLALCHADDPDNRGVMDTGEVVDLTDDEWERLRDNLDNVRDDTGYDVLFRRCLWEECLAGVAPID